LLGTTEAFVAQAGHLPLQRLVGLVDPVPEDVHRRPVVLGRELRAEDELEAGPLGGGPCTLERFGGVVVGDTEPLETERQGRPDVVLDRGGAVAHDGVGVQVVPGHATSWRTAGAQPTTGSPDLPVRRGLRCARTGPGGDAVTSTEDRRAAGA